MRQYAIQIHTRDGSSHHLFGDYYGPSYAQAVAIRDGWRSETRAGAYYTFTPDSGEPVNIPVTEITDVRIIVGAETAR